MSQFTLKPQSETGTEKSSSVALTVEQLNVQIKNLIEGQIAHVWVRGEISNFKAHTSGHFYFSLKDAKSQISAVMFRGHNSRLKFKPADGVEVIARGKVTVYEPRGNYQIVCDMLEPVGAGALQRAFEQLKLKLKNEGLFDANRKRPLPTRPQHIAIVTSPTGAAIRDILNILSRRAKGVRITLIPTIVQGESCGAQVSQALKRAYVLSPDVIIVGRGGGSMEDLWGFNDEGLARTIAESPVPVISAVGHEIDFTIADFVADVRAPTPSAAAELVSKSSQELSLKIQQLNRVLLISMQKSLQNLQQKSKTLIHRLIDPRKKLQDLILRNDDLLERIQLAIKNDLQKKHLKVQLFRQKLVTPEKVILRNRQKVNLLSLQLKNLLQAKVENKKAVVVRFMGLLDSLSPLRVLDRGYTIVFKNEKIVRLKTELISGDNIKIKMKDGEINAIVEK